MDGPEIPPQWTVAIVQKHEYSAWLTLNTQDGPAAYIEAPWYEADED